MSKELIIQSINEKSILKEMIFQQSLSAFTQLKKEVIAMNDFMSKNLNPKGEVSFRENGSFEIEFHFGDEVLIFSLHTDIFNFDNNHIIHQSEYVKQNPLRSYCGIIKVYNFLSDSFKYNRNNDLGYLIARIFINTESHYFVEGKRQLGFLYNDFENSVLEPNTMNAILESCILYAADFDLLVPPFDEVKEITVYQKIEQMGNAAVKTGKRMGFKFQADSDQFS
jgi:hypothetical protein